MSTPEWTIWFIWSDFLLLNELTNSYEKKRSEKQRRKGKIKASECRVPKNSKKRLRKPSSAINAKK